MKNYLNFESDIKNLENELEKLKDPFNQEGLSEVDTKKISKTQEELDEKLKNIYSNLDPWQITLVARHEDRPKSKFFIDNLFDDFISLEGDRHYGEDKSVITGLAKFQNQSVLVIGQEKGENLETRIQRNFGIKATEAGYISLSQDQRTFTYGDGDRKLMTVPFDENPYSALAAFFKTDEGVEVYKAIQKKLK